MQFSPKTTKDLLHYILELNAQPGVSFEMSRDASGEICFKNHVIPSIENFEILATSYTHKKPQVKDFYPRLKNILESAVKLKSISQYINLDIKEKEEKTQKQIQENLIQNPFKVVIEDSLSKKDKLKRKKILQRVQHCIGYSIADEDFLLLANEKAHNFFAVMKDKGGIIKANIPSPKNAHNVLNQDSSIFFQFFHICTLLTEYYHHQKPPYTQKGWQNFIMNHSLQNAQKTYREIINPLIMHLVDNTRRFLVDTLLQEHGLEIAFQKQEAQTKLKKEKNLIYTLSEKYGYIKKAISFIRAEKIRNACAHLKPNVNTHRFLENFSDLYQNFVFTFIDENFLKSYYKQFPFLFPLTDLAQLEEDNSIVCDAESLVQQLEIFLPENIKQKGKKEKLDYLKLKGFLKQEEIQKLSDLFLKRNAIAHGQTGKEIRKLPSHLSDIQHALIHRQKYL